MVVKKYLVRDMPEALVRIKKDLGPEAVIISSYRVPGRGLKGLFVKRLEVTAALDDQREDKYFGRLRESTGRRSVPTPGTPAAADHPGSAGAQPGRAVAANWWNLVPRLIRPLPVPGQSAGLGLVTNWRSRLASLQLSEDLVQMVLEDVKTIGQGRGQGEEEFFRYWLEQRLAGWCQRYCVNPEPSRVVVLTGPAGTGKTTTLVKLAARDVLFREEKVAIVSLNSSARPGGNEALRHWARLLNVPFAVVADPEELSRVLAGWGGVERFYLDTPSDPFFKAGKLLELAGFLSQIQTPEVLLVLSATTRDADLQRAVAQVSRFSCGGMVMTKVDEMSSLGPLLNLLPRLSLPLQYLGIGREVPDDLYPAGGALLTSLLLGGGGRDEHSSPGLMAAK